MEQTALVYGHLIHPSGRRLWAQTTRHLRTAGLSTALVAAVPGTRLMFASTGAGLLSFDSQGRRTAVCERRRPVRRAPLRLAWSRRWNGADLRERRR